MLRVFFHMLYHPFAFSYDLVAAAVSFGRWKDWVFSIVPFIEGTRILELGHGPGHLQRLLCSRNLTAFGLDESAQMGLLAKGRLGADARLARGLAQSLPFKQASFDSVVATFPTEYIFSSETLLEVRRVLGDRGRLVVLPGAWPADGFLQWLYRVTGESPAALDEVLKKKFEEPFIKAGFRVNSNILHTFNSTLLVIIAES